MRSAERRKVNVLEMKCLRSLVGVSRMDRVRNEEIPNSIRSHSAWQLLTAFGSALVCCDA